MKTASEILIEAADLLEREGWMQGSFGSYSRGGPCCMIGACLRVIEPWRIEPWHSNIDGAAGHLAAYLDLGEGELLTWNDAPGRTAEEVIHALREAAKL